MERMDEVSSGRLNVAIIGLVALLLTASGAKPLHAASALPLTATGSTCAAVSWTTVVNASTMGSTMQKTGRLTAWDAGATSSASIQSGDGSAQVTADSTAYGRMFGLTHNETSPSYSDITYAMELQSNGTLAIYESGVGRATLGAYAVGDVLKVAVEGGVVHYYRNSTLLYSSSIAPSYPLLMDASIRDPGGQVANAVVCGASADTRGDWPTYVADNARSGFNGAEAQITPATAPHMTLRWSVQAGGKVYAQPLEAHSLIYWGSYDGYEHATDLTGRAVWTTFLGTTTVSSCEGSGPLTAGLVSSGTIGNVSLAGSTTSVLFEGGGDAQLYALNALTGALLWKTRLGPSPNNFIESSPALYNGSVYVGLASFGDCPLTQGKLFKLDATTGAIQATFNVVPSGCIGGDVWGSPSIDPADNTLYIGTGNFGACTSAEPYAQAVVELRTADLSVVGAWRPPQMPGLMDSDFGSAPTLFTATTGSTVSRLVGIANKNGVYYAFSRNLISAGPVWSRQIAQGSDDPNTGGSIAPSAWDGSTLYAAGGPVTINGVSCQASVWALVPASGAVRWERCFNDGVNGGPVLGAVTAVPGLVAVGMGKYAVVLAATSGQTLLAYLSDAPFWSAASIAHGVLYQGNNAGHLFALAPPSRVRVDAGSTSSYTDSVGDSWQADTGFVGGSIVNRGNIAITGTTDPVLYQTEHYGMSSYATSLPNGAYVVNLHFAETYSGVTAAGQRVFNVNVNGVTLNNIDPFAQTGGRDRALVESATVKVTNGTLSVAFTQVSAQNPPEINAIEILPTD